jgi:hypothetical protein
LAWTEAAGTLKAAAITSRAQRSLVTRAGLNPGDFAVLEHVVG